MKGDFLKYRILAIIVVAVMLFSITVSASSYEYTILTDNNFISARSDDDLAAISEKLNMTTQDLHSYFTKNGLVYIAVSLDGKSQVKLSAFTDNFSSEVGDISYLDDAVMAEFIDAVSDNSDSPAEVITNNGRKFLCLKDTLKDSGGVYTVTQYITICNNQTFYFAGYNDGEDTSQEISDIFKSFKLNEIVTKSSDDTTPKGDKLVLQTILIYCSTAVFALLAIIALLGILKPYFKKSQELNDHEN